MSIRMRIHDKWRNKERRGSAEDNATALAYIIWQIALTAAKNLHAEDFEYDSDQQRIGVIAEYLIFLVHVTDRLAHEQMDDETRARFVTTVATHVARHYQRNVEDIMGRGDYRGQFVDLLNERVSHYAETAFGEDGPGYQARRYLGEKVQNVMGMTQTNRWVMQQVIDLDAPEAVNHLRQALENLLGTSTVTLLRPGGNAVVGPD